MSILINGMEMPMSCRQCSLYLQSMDSERNVYENCAVTAKSYNWGLTTRPSDCPLVPVPPHGRLIDADALMEEFRLPKDLLDPAQVLMHITGVRVAIQTAPTIIPAEEGK